MGPHVCVCVCVGPHVCVCVCVCKLLLHEKAKATKNFVGILWSRGSSTFLFFLLFFLLFFFFFFQIGHPWPIRAGFFGIFRGKWGGGGEHE